MYGRTVFCLIAVALVFALMRPSFPVWAGLTLLAFVAAGARFEITCASPGRRWAALKRMALMSLVGGALICIGARIEAAPWNLTAVSPAQARHAMAAMAVYGFALVVPPVLAWAHLSMMRPTRRAAARGRKTASTLSELTASACSEPVGTAV